MKQKTIATRHLRTKIAAGYVLILFVIFGIVYILAQRTAQTTGIRDYKPKDKMFTQGHTRGIC